MRPARRRLLAALSLLAATAGAAAAADREQREETYAKLAIFARVLNHIQTSYARAVDPTDLLYAAARGMVDELDSRSEFLTPDELRALRARARRLHFDLGFEVAFDDGAVVIAAVERGSFAERRGMAVGQRLVAIDRGPVPDSKPAVEEALFDFSGTSKHLTLGDAEGHEVSLRLRFEELRRATVRARPRSGLLHLAVQRFTEDTPVELIAALRAHRPIRGLVLDLRGNTGGVVDAAARIADLWLDRGTIATTEARGRVLERFEAHRERTEPRYPMVVMVDDRTASAAELVAAALAEAGRARLVGRETFGKGTVQTVIELEDGAGLRLTVSAWFTAQHRSVEGRGLEPDVRVGEAAAWATAARIVRAGMP